MVWLWTCLGCVSSWERKSEWGNGLLFYVLELVDVERLVPAEAYEDLYAAVELEEGLGRGRLRLGALQRGEVEHGDSVAGASISSRAHGQV